MRPSEHAIADAAVIVPVRIERRTETLQEAHRAQPRTGRRPLYENATRSSALQSAQRAARSRAPGSRTPDRRPVRARQEWLATWLAHHEDLDAESVPAYAPSARRACAQGVGAD